MFRILNAIIPLFIFALIVALLLGWKPFPNLEYGTALPELQSRQETLINIPRAAYVKDQISGEYMLARFETPIRIRIIENDSSIEEYIRDVFIPALSPQLDIAISHGDEPYNIAIVETSSATEAFSSLSDDFMHLINTPEEGNPRDISLSSDINCRRERMANGAEITAGLILIQYDPLADPIGECLKNRLPELLGFVRSTLGGTIYVGGSSIAPPMRDGEILALHLIYNENLHAGMLRSQVEAILENLSSTEE